MSDDLPAKTESSELVKIDPKASTGLSLEALKKIAGDSAVETWFKNIRNPHTKRAYLKDVLEFGAFAGITKDEDLQQVQPLDVTRWRDELEASGLAHATIRRKLAALSSLFSKLCEKQVVWINPVAEIQRPGEGANEGKTPALSDDQAKALLRAPQGSSLKAVRDRAIIATFLFHGLRRSEVAGLKIGSLEERRGVMHFVVHGKREKTRYVPVHPAALHAIDAYLATGGHGETSQDPLFQPVRNRRRSADGEAPTTEKAISGDGLWRVLRSYADTAGIRDMKRCLHALRATAATNALENKADIGLVQDWLGHASPATTRLYDRRRSRPEDSPTFKISY